MVDKLRIYLKNLYNYGTVKFDDVYLFRDAAGTYYNYNNNGDLISKESASGATHQAQYNENNDIERSIDPLGNMTVYEYDSNRNLTKTESPMGIFVNNEYDNFGNLTSSYLSKSNSIQNRTLLKSGYTTYDANGLYATQTTDAFGHTTEYTVNPTTLKVEEIKYGKPSPQSDSYNYRTEYNYYDNGTGPIKQINGLYEASYETKAFVSFEYDKGRLNKINRTGYYYKLDEKYEDSREYVDDGHTPIPYNFKTTTRVVDNTTENSINIGKNLYDAKGRLTATIYGGSNYHRFDNDVLGRLTAKHTLLDKFTYIYNSKGYLSSVNSQNNNISQSYSYDLAGRLSVSEFYNDNTGEILKHKYSYDLADRVTKVNRVYTDENGQKDVVYTTYQYDNDGRMTNQNVYNESSGYFFWYLKWNILIMM